MSMLPAIPVLLLGVFVVWFFWPKVIDPLAHRATRRRVNDRDRLAETLFEAWNKQHQPAQRARG